MPTHLARSEKCEGFRSTLLVIPKRHLTWRVPGVRSAGWGGAHAPSPRKVTTYYSAAGDCWRTPVTCRARPCTQGLPRRNFERRRTHSGLRKPSGTVRHAISASLAGDWGSRVGSRRLIDCKITSIVVTSSWASCRPDTIHSTRAAALSDLCDGSVLAGQRLKSPYLPTNRCCSSVVSSDCDRGSKPPAMLHTSGRAL